MMLAVADLNATNVWREVGQDMLNRVMQLRADIQEGFGQIQATSAFYEHITAGNQNPMGNQIPIYRMMNNICSTDKFVNFKCL